MSGGTPVSGGGSIRQRHSQGSSNSGSDDVEDDATSPVLPPSVPLVYRAQTTRQVLENVLWIVASVFIIYLGDLNSNFISIICWDERIRRKTLFLGILLSIVNTGIILYMAVVVHHPIRSSEKYAVLPFSSAVPFIVVLGTLSYFIFSIAVWPIWGILSLPLLFTLLMTFMVILSYLPIEPFNLQSPQPHVS